MTTPKMFTVRAAEYMGEEVDIIAHAHGKNRRRDVMDGGEGFVSLVDCMPRLVSLDRKSADPATVQAARVSFGGGLKSEAEDVSTLRFMMRSTHTTPFEMVEFKFHCKMPLFVARQWIRHRTANVNEKSGRYSVMEDLFHHPSEVRSQSTANKQGSGDVIKGMTSEDFLRRLDEIETKAYAYYEEAVKDGVAKEQARIILPTSVYTEWYWKIDLHNLLHFLALRCDSHAQLEIRVYAEAMLDLITPIVPEAVRAWNDYHPMRGGMLLSRMEVEAMRRLFDSLNDLTTPLPAPLIDTSNKREQNEWAAKAKRFGVEVTGLAP